MIAVVAAFTSFFQVMAAFLRLAAVFPVLALSFTQSLFRTVNPLPTPSVAIMVIKGLRGDGPGQKPGKYQRCNQHLAFLAHSFPSSASSNLKFLGMHQSTTKPYEPCTKGVHPSFTLPSFTLPWPGKSKEIAPDQDFRILRICRLTQ
jgi:hypothetical protein